MNEITLKEVEYLADFVNELNKQNKQEEPEEETDTYTYVKTPPVSLSFYNIKSRRKPNV